MGKPRHTIVKYNPDYIHVLTPPTQHYLMRSADKKTIFRRNEDRTLTILTNDQTTVSTLNEVEARALGLWLLGDTE